jgi:hypothetical protein
MKLKELKIKEYTLLKLHLLKHQVFKKSIHNSRNYLELSIKQVLNLIYFYHHKNKQIMFIGFPYIKNKSILKRFKHSFVPKNFWVNGLMSNFEAKKSLKNVNISTENQDLIVFLNPSKEDFEIINELVKSQIPLIVIGHEVPSKFTAFVCQIPIVSQKIFVKQFFFFLIKSVLR